jgi:ferric-dicitrate binding protein FerR (iron transport regulator)
MARIYRQQTGTKADQYASRMLSGEMSSLDEQEITAWQAAEPENAAKLEASLEVWASVEGLANDPELVESVNATASHHTSRQVGRAWRTVGIAAGILALGLTLVLTSINRMHGPHNPIHPIERCFTDFWAFWCHN